ncbi:MAG: biopolymer transporter ExbD [Terriglobales bacterium]|jgi:biopolymer transport protein ExbD/biopolymer transport protein TolR
MKHILEVCLVALTLASLTPSAVGQAPAEVPLQRGISVDLPVTHSAVAIPEADKEEAIVVVVTGNGDIFLGTDRTGVAALPKRIKSTLSRSAEVLFIKADARAPYSTVVSILDSLNAAGLRKFALLTTQGGSEKPRTFVSPRGLEMQMTSVQ